MRHLHRAQGCGAGGRRHGNRTAARVCRDGGAAPHGRDLRRHRRARRHHRPGARDDRTPAEAPRAVPAAGDRSAQGGPPGTGKTLLARAVANEGDAHFFHIAGPEIMGRFYGESEQQVTRLFARARQGSRPRCDRASVTPGMEREYEQIADTLRHESPRGRRRIGFTLPETAAAD